MLVTYLRSSLLGGYDFCENKCFIGYVLGIPDKINGKSQMGNVVHKSMELFAQYKIAKQNNKRHFVDDIFGKISFKDVSVENFNELAHAHYEAQHPGIMPKNSKDLTLAWTHLALTRIDGEMDPRNQNVHAVEEFFEVEVPHEWADYEYEIDGEIIKGRLGLKGTVDLITKEDDVYFNIVDYKTGRRYDWGKDKIKEVGDFETDKQLLLYYYALRLKYPEKQFHVSIYYINDHVIDKVLVPGGLFSFAFDDSHFQAAERMIQERFEKIKNNNLPRLLNSKCAHWKCKSLCAYSQIIPEISCEKPACLHIHDEIKRIGIDAVTAKYADKSRLGVYQGGGRQSVEISNPISKGE